MEHIERFIRTRAKYIDGPGAIEIYKYWIDDIFDTCSESNIRQVALRLVCDKEVSIVRSALCALAWTGSLEDIASVVRFESDPFFVEYFKGAKKQILHNSKSLEQHLEGVVDKKTFDIFVLELAKERERAQKIENAKPNTYVVDGALGWKNTDIPSFLYSALTFHEFEEDECVASWRTLANFLYQGKVYD